MTMNDRTTDEVKMLAHEVVHQQSELCDAKRDYLRLKDTELERAVAANVSAIGVLMTAVATLTTNVAVIKGRPGIYAFFGGMVPGLLAVILWWLSRGNP